MNSSSDPEIEPYEETVRGLSWEIPFNPRVLGTVTDAPAPTVGPPFHGPMLNSRRQTVETTDLFAHAPRPILRHPDELARVSQEPRTGVAATNLTV